MHLEIEAIVKCQELINLIEESEEFKEVKEPKKAKSKSCGIGL